MDLKITATPRSKIELGKSSWHLEIPSGQPRYRLAQLDDYSKLRRQDFYWNPCTSLKLMARVSSQTLPGTWGFGLWNDPFSMFFGLGGMKRFFPVFPNAAWFFYASPENYISFRNDRPSYGFLAATFRSTKKKPLTAIPQLALFPLLLSRAWARSIRKKLSEMIREESYSLDIDVSQWNSYSITWNTDRVSFTINNKTVFSSTTVPRGPLGLVIWIDNQYAAFKPSGEIKAGVLRSDAPAWMELAEVKISHFS